MVRRLIFVVAILLAATLPAAALHKPSTLPASGLHKPSNQFYRATGVAAPLPPDPLETYAVPLLIAISWFGTILGVVPGVIAYRKDMPHWSRTLFLGFFLGVAFFPAVIFLLYKVLNYTPEPLTNQSEFRPMNPVVVFNQGQEATDR